MKVFCKAQLTLNDGTDCVAEKAITTDGIPAVGTTFEAASPLPGLVAFVDDKSEPPTVMLETTVCDDVMVERAKECGWLFNK